jgi:hypothetical protein
MDEKIDKGRLLFGTFGLIMITSCIIAWYGVYEKIVSNTEIFEWGFLTIGVITGLFGLWILKRGITQQIPPQATVTFTATILAISGVVIYLSFY